MIVTIRLPAISGRFATRSVATSAAPTQMLGEAIRRDQRGLEGFAFLSARLPYHRNLAVFPEALGGGSYVEYEMQDPGSGQSRRFRVDATYPEGRLV